MLLIRYANDVIIGAAREDDARRIMEVLPKQMNKYRVTVHPEKTRLVRFGPHEPGDSAAEERKHSEPRTFDFLGITATLLVFGLIAAVGLGGAWLRYTHIRQVEMIQEAKRLEERTVFDSLLGQQKVFDRRTIKVPEEMASCSEDAVAGYSEDVIDVVALTALRRRTMYRPCFHLASLTLLLTLAPATWAGDVRDLFDGMSLDGWVVEGPAKDKTGRTMWFVEDGRIVCLGEGFGFLRYDRQEFSDFTLRVEYRFTPKSGSKPSGNSGLGIRTRPFDPARSRETRPSYAAFEVQLLDDAGSPPSAHGTGSLYRYKSPTTNPTRRAPEWNTIEVSCTGPRITVRLNGRTILEADQSELPDVKSRPAGVPAPKDKPRKGYVALQSHSGRVEFRKVQIREANAERRSGHD